MNESGNQILHTSKYPLKYALFEKSQLKCIPNTIITLDLYCMK